MRLWDYRLLKVLPDRFIVSQWRECIAIKRQWEKGTLKHRLVSYVMDYDKKVFREYTRLVIKEMNNRNIKHQDKYFNEIIDFCGLSLTTERYKEHNDRYFVQCYYNLEEKHDRGIITKEEWQKIDEYYTREVMGYGN